VGRIHVERGEEQIGQGTREPDRTGFKSQSSNLEGDSCHRGTQVHLDRCEKKSLKSGVEDSKPCRRESTAATVRNIRKQGDEMGGKKGRSNQEEERKEGGNSKTPKEGGDSGGVISSALASLSRIV